MAASARDVPQATGEQGAFRDKLVAEGLLVPSRIPGVTGQGPVFVDLRQRLDARISKLVADEGAIAGASHLKADALPARRDVACQ